MSTCPSLESDIESDIEEADNKKMSHLTPQGRIMAELISEFLFLRYFFGKMDRRKLQVLKQNFMVDM